MKKSRKYLIGWFEDMNNAVKKFIEENINLIEEDKWEKLYQEAIVEFEDEDADYIGAFTETMIEAGINPELYLSELPDYFLCGSHIQTFSIPPIVKSIAFRAFYNCRSLTNITISDNVVEIGNNAFEDCRNLVNVIIPSNVNSIGYYSFYKCKNLKSISILNKATIIKDYTFQDCGDELIIDYSGTKEEWKKIYSKDAFINTYFTVNCTDGKFVKRKR